MASLIITLSLHHLCVSWLVIFDGTLAHLTSNELRKQLPWKHLRHQTVYSSKKLNATDYVDVAALIRFRRFHFLCLPLLLHIIYYNLQPSLLKPTRIFLELSQFRRLIRATANWILYILKLKKQSCVVARRPRDAEVILILAWWTCKMHAF